MTRRELDKWIENAEVGERKIYYIGFLFADREYHHDKGVITSLANAAWEAMKKGRIHLYQKRLHNEGLYEYIAIRRPNNMPAVTWTGCYAQDGVGA
jgi:hypothetical protein